MITAHGCRLLYIEWIDCRAHSSRWEDMDIIKKEECALAMCVSVGFLLEETKDYYIIAPNFAKIGSQNPDVSSGTTIPKVCVRKLRRL